MRRLAIAALLLGCASGPQVAAPVTPQLVSIVIDAHDGGQITISGDVWLDARGSASAEQTGTDVDAPVDADVQSTVTAGAP